MGTQAATAGWSRSRLQVAAPRRLPHSGSRVLCTAGSLTALTRDTVLMIGRQNRDMNTSETWQTLGSPRPETLTDARLQLHWAAQLVASVGKTYPRAATRRQPSQPGLGRGEPEPCRPCRHSRSELSSCTSPGGSHSATEGRAGKRDQSFRPGGLHPRTGTHLAVEYDSFLHRGCRQAPRAGRLRNPRPSCRRWRTLLLERGRCLRGALPMVLERRSGPHSNS